MPGGDPRELPGVVLAAIALGLAVQLTPVAEQTEPAPVVVAPAPVAAVVARPVVLTDVASVDRTVVLTFDDGPDPQWTPQVLDVLARHGAVATFCMVGNAVSGREQLVRRVIAAGMRLCDHSRTHDLALASRPRARITDEIVGTQSLLAAASDAPVEFFRAPGGGWSPEVLQIAASHGMQPVGWSVDTYDWRRPGVGAIVAAVQQNVRPGAVILLHDGGGRREQTIAALEQLLPWLIEQGYRFTFPTPG